MTKQLKIISERCTGCRSCELVCALMNDGELNPSKSRIALITFIEGKYTLPYHFVSTCRQCADAPCLAACPVGAISRVRSKTKIVVVDRNCCIGCGKCVEACPFGAMLFDRQARKVWKCELCGGNPVCASICPSQVIVYKDRKPFYAKDKDLEMKGFAILAGRNKENTKSPKQK